MVSCLTIMSAQTYLRCKGRYSPSKCLICIRYIMSSSSLLATKLRNPNHTTKYFKKKLLLSIFMLIFAPTNILNRL